MLSLSIRQIDTFDPNRNEFLTFPAANLQLEHSLKSISKWEARTHRSFFEAEQMAPEDFIEYVRCMTVKIQGDTGIYGRLLMPFYSSYYHQIIDYISDPMTAKKFYQRKSKKGKVRGSVPTSESIYFLMIKYGIPFECENWHFGRLMALIRTCEGNSGGEPMSYRERQQWYNELNDQRRLRLGTKG